MKSTAVTTIEKKSLQKEVFHRPYQVFPQARSAFCAFLKTIAINREGCVLLPAYIGWSSREGSGVFDPVETLGLDYDFYRLDRNLHIDMEHLETVLKTRSVNVVVLIHYFGGVDPNYKEAVSLARKHGALVLEDEAHAMLTDLVGGASGRAGDASLFSLHKILPVETGGMLVVNSSGKKLLSDIESSSTSQFLPWEYDLHEISLRRRNNMHVLKELLEPLGDFVKPLWDWSVPEHIPQSFPVIIQHASRDELYFSMNSAGFGVVSLYHTMIKPITKDEYPDSHYLANHILNLPIHQDIEPEMLEPMVNRLRSEIRGKCVINGGHVDG